jgi:TPR repeat protein
MGISRDARLAHEMYRSAAEAGYTPAMVRVSDDHARGLGARRNLVEAYAWLEVALQMGLPGELQIPALSRMDDLAARLRPKRREEARLRAAHLAAVVQMRGRTNPGAAENVSSVSGQ